ncbi:MAG: hypothetical protein ACT6RD_04690 [Brevundimonas sp.]|uniref:hypothetical protein n=1 Tax=Brevundimonas sp. TaxID=1871086 RepID=UPI004033FC82
MKVVPPKLKRLELRGAFKFDVEFFAAQKRLFESIAGEQAISTYSLQVRSGAKYEVDSLEGLELLPFNDVEGRSSFSAKYEAARQSLELEIRYLSPAWISISSWSEQAAERLAGEAMSAVRARRLWYSWIFGFWTGGLVAVPVGLFLGATLPISLMTSPKQRVILIACAAYFVLFGLAFLARRFLFDTVVMMVGSEAARQSMLTKSRTYLFGTVIGGIAISVIGAVVAGLFSPA